MAGEVYVVEKASGRLAKVSESELANLNPVDFRQPSPDEIPELEQKIRADGQILGSGAEGLMRGASLSAFDVWARENSSPEELAAIEARSKTLAGRIGEGLGMVVPMLFSGGTGAVAKGASVMPSAMAARGAAAVGTRAGEALAARGVGNVGVRAGALATEGAVEGAIVGAAQAVSESSLADQDLEAEKIFAGAGEGALWGGVGGGLLGGGIAAASKLPSAIGSKYSRARESITARRAAREGAPPGAADEALDGLTPTTQAAPDGDMPAPKTGVLKETDEPGFVDKVLSRISGGDAATIKRARSLDEDGVRMRDNYIRRDELIEQHTKKLTRHIDEMSDTEKVVRSAFAGKRKAETVAASVKRGPETVANSQAFIQQLKAETADLLTLEGRETVGKTGAIRMRKLINRTEKNVAKLVDKGGDIEPQLFLEMDNLKRGFQKWTKSAGRVRSTDHIKQAESTAFNEYANGIQQRVLAHLEDTNTYGQAAAQQAKRNAVGSAYFDTATDFGRRFLFETGERLDAESWWLQKRVANPDNVSRHVEGLLDYRKDIGHQMTLKSVQARRELLDVMIEQGDVPTKDLATFKRARDATVEFESTLKEAGESLSDANAIANLVRIERERSVLGGLAGGALGGSMLGGPVGAVIGGTLGAAVRPANSIHKLAVMESITQRSARIDQKIDAGIAKHIKREATTTPPLIKQLESRERASFLKKGARRAAVPAAAAIVTFGGDPEKRRTKFNKISEQVREFQANPTAAVDHIQRNVIGSLADPAPAFSAALSAKHAAAMSFLATKLPAPPPSHLGRSLQPHLQKHRVSDAEIERFARSATAVAKPLSIIEDMQAGKLSYEAVEAVKAVYPKLYEQIRVSAMTALANTKQELPYNSVIQLGILLDFTAHPTLEPAFLARHQERLAALSQGSPTEAAPAPATSANQPSAGAPKFAKSALTMTERINQSL